MTSSSVLASRAGLSQRMRLTRGNRMATPDLWRVERFSPSKAISSTRPKSRSARTDRTGPEGLEELVPVGKAYFGFTDEELKQIDKFVRDNTIERFGPVRSVRADRSHGLVLEIAFEGLNRSTRHKSGVAMRFPRISRLRWDKPTHEADRIETLQALLD